MKLNSYNILELQFKCSKCDYRESRRPTREEIDELKQDNLLRDILNKNRKTIHTLFHRFHERFMTFDGDGYMGSDFKFHGYDLMQKVEKFVRYNPSCALIHCDDNLHCGSYILLIPHELDKEYWGTTVVNIPQYGIPTCLFLYPYHLEQMLVSLKTLNKRYKNKEPLRKKKEKEKREQFFSHGKFRFKPATPVVNESVIEQMKKRSEKALEKFNEE